MTKCKGFVCRILHLEICQFGEDGISQHRQLVTEAVHFHLKSGSIREDLQEKQTPAHAIHNVVLITFLTPF